MNSSTPKIPITFWVIGAIALIWNLMGVGAFVSDMMMSPEALAALTPEQQDLYANNPLWMKIVYGVATIGGLLGSIGLLMRKTWAVPLFLASLVTVIVQMGYSTFVTNAHEIMGSGIAFPIIITLIAAFLWYYSKKSETNGILE